MKKAKMSRKIVALIMAMTMILGGIPSLVFAEDIMADLPSEETIEVVGQDELYFEEPDFTYTEEEILYAEESLDFADEAGELVLEEDQDEVLFDESELYYEEPDVLIEEEESIVEEEPEVLFETEPEEEAPSDDSDLTEEDSEELDIDIVAAAAKIPGTRATLSADAVKILPDSLGAYGCEFRPYPGTPAEEKLTFNIGLEGETDGAPNQAIYAWKEEGVVYYWSPAETVYLPNASGNLFSKPRGAAGAWWTFIDLSGFDFSEVWWMDGMFGGYTVPDSHFIAYNDDLLGVDFGDAYTPNLRNMRLLFAGCHNLKSVDMSTFDTSHIGINPDGGWNDGRMDRMFEDCWSLESLDISSFDTSHNPDMYHMFYSCKSLKSLDVSRFNTSNVTNMKGMFFCCESLTSLDVTGFDTSNVTDMNTMFSGCRNLQALDVSRLNTSNVTDMGFMLSGLQTVTKLDVSRFNTGNVTNMEYMFQGCYNLKELDVSNFDVSNVTYAQSMFAFDFALERIYSNRHWSNLNADNAPYMFSQCTSLASNRGTKPGTEDGSMARVDGYDDNMNRNDGYRGRGYFTYNGEETTEVSVTKIWDDEDNRDGSRPASLEITLFRDGSQTNNKIYLNADNGWTSTFTNLTQYSNARDGIQYTYTVKEAVVEGYNVDAAGVSRAADAAGSIATGFTFTNKHIPVLEIIEQPKNFIAHVGERATFSIKARGATGYQWSYSKDGKTWYDCTATYYDGCKTDSVEFDALAKRNGWLYKCVVTGGNQTIESYAAGLTVTMDEARILTQPKDISARDGDRVVMSIVADNATGYQWKYSKDGATWYNCTETYYIGSKTNAIEFDALAKRNGWLYKCSVTGESGTIDSKDAVLTVDDELRILVQPSDISARLDEIVTLSIKAENAKGYQWKYSKDGATWYNCTETYYKGCKTDNIEFDAQLKRNGWQYKCTVTGKDGPIDSETAVLRIVGDVKILIHPSDISAHIGERVTLGIEAENAIAYRWWYSKDGKTWYDCTETYYIGSRTKTIEFDALAKRNGWLYKCVVTGVNGTVDSNPAVLTILGD